MKLSSSNWIFSLHPWDIMNLVHKTKSPAEFSLFSQVCRQPCLLSLQPVLTKPVPFFANNLKGFGKNCKKQCCGSVFSNTGKNRINYSYRQKVQDWRQKFSVSDPDPHKEMPSGSGSAWTDDAEQMRIRIQDVKKPRKCTGSLGEYRTGRIKVRILL